MKIKEYFENLPKGEVVDKRGLAYLKRKGLIWNYSRFGYLEAIRLEGKRDNEGIRAHLSLNLFPKGNAKDCEQYEGSIIGKDRQGRANCDLNFNQMLEKYYGRTIKCLGVTFEEKYLDGCFSPYLVKAGPSNGKEVSRRMAFANGII